MDFRHYSLVPKDFAANLRFRRSLLLEGATDPLAAGQLWAMCAEDPLFYVNTFCWTQDPRQLPSQLPFITYDFQDELFDDLFDAIAHPERKQDLGIEKTRCMGASWCLLTAIEQAWHFSPYALSFGCCSRGEAYVDKRGEPKSLFWKLDYLHDNQPRWLLPPGRDLGWADPNRKLLSFRNAATGSTISGEATTGDFFRGGRLTFLLLDEYATVEVADGYRGLRATRDVTNCRAFNSTPKGTGTAFYDVIHNSAAKRVTLHWREHPVYRRGLYTSRQVGKEYVLDLLDREFTGQVDVLRKDSEDREIQRLEFPAEYPFILDGKLRSPWYDSECARCVNETEIAQELDIDYLGSDYQFFPSDMIEKLIAETCQRPVLRGDLEYDSGTLEPLAFRVDVQHGRLELWFDLPGADDLRADFSPLEGRRFGLGSDIGFGTGASNSATSIADLDTGEKVAVWRDSHTDPDEFADITVALARWFNGGKMGWDATGAPGRKFTLRVLERGYSNLFYRETEDSIRRRVSDQPGVFLSPEEKYVLLKDYRRALDERKFTNRSEPGLRECMQFIVEPGGKIEHVQALNSQDPRGAREAHGDEAIADAVLSKLVTGVSQQGPAPEPEPPYMSIAWRLREDQLAAEAAAAGANW